MVEVLHLPHPKLLGLLHVGEHLQEKTERSSATRNQYITQKPTTQPEANRTNTQANHQPEPKPDQETAPVHFSVGGGVGSPARALPLPLRAAVEAAAQAAASGACLHPRLSLCIQGRGAAAAEPAQPRGFPFLDGAPRTRRAVWHRRAACILLPC